LGDLEADGNNVRLNDCQILKKDIFIQDSYNSCCRRQILVKYTVIRHVGAIFLKHPIRINICDLRERESEIFMICKSKKTLESVSMLIYL
jgi:hypothetical protein